MDIVTNATRISSSDVNHDISKESSSPSVTTNQSLVESQFSTHTKRYNPRIRMQRQLKEPKAFNEIKRQKEQKFGKQHELISNSERFQLCLQFMANNITMRQVSGTIINRLKGKITEVEYTSNLHEIETRKVEFFLELDRIKISKKDEIDSGYLEPETCNIITEAVARIPLKGKNANQKSKLKVKIITQLASQAIYVTSSDPLIALKQQLMDLSPDERIKVLGAIPL